MYCVPERSIPVIVFTYQHLAVPPVSMFDLYYVKYKNQRCLI